MAWSTRELADLAGTSLRSVRHYHEVGLLPEPERRSNGYKQYGVAHLMRLLRIKRLVELGFSLAQVADLGDRDEHPEEALRAVDADLVAQIERLQALRADLAEMLAHGVPTDLPTGLAGPRAAKLSAADRSMTVVMGRVLSEHEQRIYAGLLTEAARMPSDDEFDALPPDADEATRDALAVRMADDLALVLARVPEAGTFGAQGPGGRGRYRRTVDRAMQDVYNPAQADVLLRVRRIHRRRTS